MNIHILFNLILVVFASKFENLLAKQLQFMIVQTEIMRKRLPQQIHTTPEERALLLRYGQPIGMSIVDLIYIVTPKTFSRWEWEDKHGKKPRRKGRPKITESIRSILIRLARENIRWGYTRLKGELDKLNIQLGRNTIKRIVVDDRLSFPPDYEAVRWKQFVERHIDSLWACDFGIKKIWTLSGRKTYHFLFFIHVGTRKVFYAGSSRRPKSDWMNEQANAFLQHAEQEGLQLKILLHDHDTKFKNGFQVILNQSEVKTVKVPILSPFLNGYAESWIGKLKHECLNHFVVVSKNQLDYIIQEYVDHYNTERPHQGKNNQPLTKLPKHQAGEIKRHSRLGGLLNHYYRETA